MSSPVRAPIHLEHDWFPRGVPGNVSLGEDVYLDSAYGFATMNAKNKQLAFMQGIQNKDIQIQGNTALVMWFQGLTKYLKPRKKKPEAA